jgi:hypothetical protein
MRGALAVVALAGCQAVVGIDDITEAPCVARAPIDFASAGLFPVPGRRIAEVRAVELTGDAVPELVVVQLDAMAQLTTLVLVGAAGPGIPTFRPQAMLVPGAARFADLDGDGLLDVLAPAIGAAPGFQVWLNRTTPGAAAVTLGPPAWFGPAGGAAPIVDLAVADATRDGTPDVITVDATGVAAIWERVPAGSAVDFRHGETVGEPAELASARLALADLDADGNPDLVVATSVRDSFGQPGPTTIAIAHHAATRDGFEAPVELTHVGEAVTRLVPADVDGDGRLDLVVGTVNHHQIWLARPGAGFVLAAPTTCTGALGAVADHDGDGALDVVSLEPETILCELASAGGDDFASHPIAATHDDDLFGIPDVNHDGRPELVGARSGAFELLVSGSHCEPAR